MNIGRQSMNNKYLTIKNGLYSILGVMVLGLVFYNIKDMILGSPFRITTATDGSTLSSPLLPIEGVAKHAKEVLINGRPITMDRKGAFNDQILLSPGYNIVEVAHLDQFGNKKIKTYQIVLSVPQAVAVTPKSPYQ